MVQRRKEVLSDTPVERAGPCYGRAGPCDGRAGPCDGPTAHGEGVRLRWLRRKRSPAASAPAAMHDQSQFDEAAQRAAAGRAARASDEFVAVYYDTLRSLAASTLSRTRDARSLPPTALVHEAWLRLVKDAPEGWESQRHFLGVATRVMREILIERQRSRGALRRGGSWARVELQEGLASVESDAPDWLALTQALARLEQHDARKAEVVNLRFFAGLTIEDTARALAVSTATVERDWEFAKAWLHRELRAERDS